MSKITKYNYASPQWWQHLIQYYIKAKNTMEKSSRASVDDNIVNTEL